MRKLWRGIVGTLFWTYERGSWPYDVMVLVIVLFVLATPRRWFHDAPLAAEGHIRCIRSKIESADHRTMTYHLDAACLPEADRAEGPSPKMESDIHGLLARSAPELAGRTFEVQSIHPETASAGGAQSYDVTVRPVDIP